MEPILEEEGDSNKHATEDLSSNEFNPEEELSDDEFDNYLHNQNNMIGHNFRMGEIEAAIRREKAIKRWTRAWKIELIESVNPTWEDLTDRMNW